MKTISVSAAKGVKSKPVSLSKAAKYLAKFVESDSGASEANLGFLKRASVAFNELNAFHKEIRKAKSRRSRRGAELDENVKSENEVIGDDRKEHKKKKKNDREKEVEDGAADDLNRTGVEAAGEDHGRKRKKLGDGEEGRIGDSDDRKLKKKRKKNKEIDE